MFTTFIYQPLLNLTVFLYSTVGFGDLAIAIIAITVVVRGALLPLSLRAARSQRAMAALAPELERIKQAYPGNTTKQSEEVMRLYKERGVHPLSGCLPLLVQMPILFGMYRVFLKIFDAESISLLYSFIPHPEQINQIGLGFLNMSDPSRVLAIGAGIAQFIQARFAMQVSAGSPQAAAMNRQMLYILPAMIVVIGWNLPAGLSLYWVITTLFSIGEQLYLRRS